LSEHQHFEVLPDGVRVLHDYRSLGALVECSHAGEYATVIRVESVCCGNPEIEMVCCGAYLPTGECCSEPVAGPNGCCGQPEPRPVYMCGICKGDEQTTDDFRLPVKLLAEVPAGAREGQMVLL
jgi:hypothetical protein